MRFYREMEWGYKENNRMTQKDEQTRKNMCVCEGWEMKVIATRTQLYSEIKIPQPVSGFSVALGRDATAVFCPSVLKC